MSQPALPNGNLTCDECGRFGAIDFDEQKICPDCYEHCGSCCQELGKKETEQDC